MKQDLSQNDLKKYGRNIAEAIRNLHKNGVLHRDIKPKNILVAQNKREKTHRVKLADYGLCTKNQLPNRAGTPRYAAPESYYTENSDWISFGKMLYEMAIEAFGRKIVFLDKKKTLDPGLRDLLFNPSKGLLNPNPSQRYTGEEVVNHPYFTGVPMPEHLNKPRSKVQKIPLNIQLVRAMQPLFRLMIQQVFPDDKKLQSQVLQASKSYSRGESLTLSPKECWESFKGDFGSASGLLLWDSTQEKVFRVRSDQDCSSYLNTKIIGVIQSAAREEILNVTVDSVDLD